MACGTTTEGILERGECTDVGCLWEGIPLDVGHMVFVVVDEGDEVEVVECLEDNNTARAEVRCPPTVI